MLSQPYEDWISIYNDEMKNVWKEERVELRKVSMIYVAFQNELNKLKDILNNEMVEIQSTLKKRDLLQKCKNFSGLAQSVPFDINSEINKENEVPLKEVDLNEPQSEELLIESPYTSTFLQKCPSPPLNLKKKSTSPILNKSSLNINTNNDSSSSILFPVITHKVDKTPNLNNGRKSNEFKIPNNNDSNILECSIIEETPGTNIQKKVKLSLSRPINNKKLKLSQNKQKSTLTQMFFESKKKKNKKEIDSDGPSMSINAMIDLINDSGSETDAELDQSDSTIDNLDVKLNEKQHEDALQRYVENYDKLPERKKEKSPPFVYKEVLRGKERKKVKGWSCKDCEKYYQGLNLSPKALEKKKNECSKHRSRFPPRDETFKGFWDLTFKPTCATQKKSVFNYGKS